MPSYSWTRHRRQSLSSISRLIRMGSTIQEGAGREGIVSLDELPPVATSALEDKFRRDIDTLLEENLEFWMKFSSSLQRVHDFQRKHEELLPQHLGSASDGDGDGKQQQLRALKTELQVWSEQSAMLRGELQCRFASLCDVQEEITSALEEKGEEFTSYQAAKFQGEVLNMQQENNRVSDELQAGLDHVKGLQAEIEKKLQGGVSLSDGTQVELRRRCRWLVWRPSPRCRCSRSSSRRRTRSRRYWRVSPPPSCRSSRRT
ncbi:hypothetical protein GUJ93_ZPchr0616g33693 [Zizania palustris]|uniref:NET2A-D/KIP1-like C-terminal domain-containing protein n=1 Tax=Zizania palustris TaxID=103762 RepID=A0A8J5UXB6_ZIZPA|nr:hypothetical protein GUJ93_ZPchr0616g33693 [Zizania palustris]